MIISLSHFLQIFFFQLPASLKSESCFLTPEVEKEKKEKKKKQTKKEQQKKLSKQTNKHKKSKQTKPKQTIPLAAIWYKREFIDMEVNKNKTSTCSVWFLTHQTVSGRWCVKENYIV